MSYSFDILERAWAELARHVPAERERVAIRFGLLLSELHEANHRLEDAVSRDPRVRKLAGALDQELGR